MKPIATSLAALAILTPVAACTKEVPVPGPTVTVTATETVKVETTVTATPALPSIEDSMETLERLSEKERERREKLTPEERAAEDEANLQAIQKVLDGINAVTDLTEAQRVLYEQLFGNR